MDSSGAWVPKGVGVGTLPVDGGSAFPRVWVGGWAALPLPPFLLEAKKGRNLVLAQEPWGPHPSPTGLRSQPWDPALCVLTRPGYGKVLPLVNLSKFTLGKGKFT